MTDTTRLSVTALVSRWLVGMGLVSWRYLWATTPLHRSVTHVDTPETPPALPATLSREGIQTWRSGVGPMYRRVFRVRIVGAQHDAATVMAVVISHLERLVPSEVVRIHRGKAEGRALRAGDDFVVDMPGPWNGPVRVAVVDDAKLHLATLAGHLESGQIEFRAHDEGHRLTFEIESWARAADQRVRLLYSGLQLAKEIQLNMWVRVCLAVARESGGRPDNGVEIRTTVSPVAAR